MVRPRAQQRWALINDFMTGTGRMGYLTGLHSVLRSLSQITIRTYDLLLRRSSRAGPDLPLRSSGLVRLLVSDRD
jgi:hypothetical protein